MSYILTADGPKLPWELDEATPDVSTPEPSAGGWDEFRLHLPGIDLPLFTNGSISSAWVI